MKIKSLQLNNFRNYEKLLVDFGDDVNILKGKNASGKTNMLGAIYLLVSEIRLELRDKEASVSTASAPYISVLKKKYRPILICFGKKRKKNLYRRLAYFSAIRACGRV